MDCKVVTSHDEGDHTLFIAEVENAAYNEREPLVWYRGDFNRLSGYGGDR